MNAKHGAGIGLSQHLYTPCSWPSLVGFYIPAPWFALMGLFTPDGHKPFDRLMSFDVLVAETQACAKTRGGR